MSIRIQVFSLALALVCGMGCSTDPAPFVTVQGDVTLNGSRVTEGTLHFFREGATEADANLDIAPGGSFWLSSRSNVGCVPGHYTIVVTGKGIPKKYSMPETSDIKIHVDDDMNKIEVRMTK